MVMPRDARYCDAPVKPACCSPHPTGIPSSNPGSVTPSGCRPATIASTIGGASSVSRSGGAQNWGARRLSLSRAAQVNDRILSFRLAAGYHAVAA
jgi:hypothetical protein